MTVGGLIRRWLADPVTALATFVTVALSMVLLAAGPIYSDAIAVAALRQSVTEAGVDTGISIDVRADPASYEAIDDLVTTSVTRAVRPLDVEISGVVRSGESFALPNQSEDGQVDLAAFLSVDSFEEHVTLVGGSWPREVAEPTEIVLDARAAEVLGLHIGDSFTVEPRSGSVPAADVRLVGGYELNDRFDEFWTGREYLADAVVETESFRTVHFVTTQDSMLSGLTGRADASWRAVPSFEQLKPVDVARIRGRVGGLEDRLNDAIAPAGEDTAVASEFEVATAVPSLLADSDRSLTVARSAVLAVVLQLALLAGYALVLVAGLTVDARRSESAMLRARGAGSRQLLGSAVLEAVLLVVPMAIAAPWLAAWALEAFDEFGPLASIGLTIEPQPVRDATVAVVIAAVVIIGLLAMPAYRAARSAEQAEHRHRRQRLTSASQRVGLDLVLLVIGALALWQLSTLGDDRASSVRGRFGVDPLVIVAPTFGLIAGSFLAIRVIPVLARLAEQRIARSRSIVAALAGWQFARRPARYGRSALLVIMAIAIGTFAVTYEATWLRSQSDQADQQVGADAQVLPNRRTNDSVKDLHLVGLHEQLEGVTRSIPVVLEDVGLTGSNGSAGLLAIDTQRVAFQTSRADAADQYEEALQELRGLRPTLSSLELPGRPARIELEVGVVDAGHTDDTVGPPFGGVVVVVLQDGFGMLHQVDLGVVSPDSERIAGDLTIRSADGNVVTPEYPVSIVDIELRTSAPSPPGRDVGLRIGPLEVVDVDGSTSRVDLTEGRFRPSSDALGFLSEPTTVEMAAGQPPDGIGLVIETGASTQAVPVVYRLTPGGQTPPAEIPAVMTRSWMESSRSTVGDTVGLSGLRSEPVLVTIAGVVDALPTIDPATSSGVLIDLPTLQMATYPVSHSVRAVSEHWLDVVDEVPDAALSASPIEAVEVIVREQRRTALVSNPPALGAIGALTLGFIASAVFALVGFLGTTVVSARDRRLEFALMRALGLTMKQLRRWMLAEQVTVVIVGVVVGTAIGVGLGALVLPLVSLTQQGGDVEPSVVVTFPWQTIAILQASVVAGLVVGLAIVNAMTRRMVVGTALRAGSDA